MKVVKREEKNFEERKMYVGLEEFKVICANPTIKELNEIYGKEDSDEDKEIEYVDEKDGYDRVRISVYLKGLSSGRITKYNFFITDKERISLKDPEKPKFQFINQVCETTWTDSASNLNDRFLNFIAKDGKTSMGKKSYRKAMEGEADFYDFIRKVMRGIDYYNPETEVIFKWKDFIKGNFKELNLFLKDENYTHTFTSLNYVKTVYNDEGEKKQYNEVFIKAILPSGILSKLKSQTDNHYKVRLEEIKSDEALFKSYNIPGISETLTVYDIMGYVKDPIYTMKGNKFLEKQIENFYKTIEGEYGCQGFYKTCPVFEYSEGMDIAAGSAVINNTAGATPTSSEY